jgi:hypothetical protein
MHSLEEEWRTLSGAGAAQVTTTGVSAPGREVFSVHAELLASLYVSVALITTGVGILIRNQLTRVGPVVLMLAVFLAGALCYVPAIRARARGTSVTVVADYLLLLGALLVSADLGYAESQFHWLGDHWSRHLLILAILHALAAYALGSRLVLSVALTSLAGWFGLERGPVSLPIWELATPELGWRALLCAGTVLVWRAIDQHKNSARFRAVFDHFAANLAFWGTVSWCSDPQLRFLGLVGLLVLAGLAIRTGLRSGGESFVVYGVGYAALGIAIVIGHFLPLASLAGAVWALIIVLTAAALLRYLHDRLKEMSP